MAIITMLLAGCAGCEEEVNSDFFEPTEYGEYVYDPQPDIDAETVLDFGSVPGGERVVKTLAVRNVGRMPLVVHDVMLDPPAFSRADSVGREWQAESGDGRLLEIAFQPETSAATHGELAIHSNDPDEPIFRVTLIANQTEPCIGTLDVGSPTWEVHDGEGPMCFPDYYSPGHGDESEYEFAEVPATDAPGWRPEADDDIEFERSSSLCGFECSCRDGGDFTYFQTSLFIPEGADVERYHVNIDDVDDGARVTVFNDRFPDGVTDPQGYARLGGRQANADLAPYFEPGRNRIVITQVDDCCSISRLRGVTVQADDVVVDTCEY